MTAKVGIGLVCLGLGAAAIGSPVRLECTGSFTCTTSVGGQMKLELESSETRMSLTSDTGDIGVRAYLGPLSSIEGVVSKAVGHSVHGPLVDFTSYTIAANGHQVTFDCIIPRPQLAAEYLLEVRDPQGYIIRQTCQRR